MLEFSRHHQEAQLASKQKQSLRQLTEDEVKLDDHLQQLYQLDRIVQEHSFNVTSLQEDQVLLRLLLPFYLQFFDTVVRCQDEHLVC